MNHGDSGLPSDGRVDESFVLLMRVSQQVCRQEDEDEDEDPSGARTRSQSELLSQFLKGSVVHR